MRLLVLIDPPARLNPATDTTLVLIAETVRRGHHTACATLASLALDGRRVSATQCGLSARTQTVTGMSSDGNVELGEAETTPLDGFDLVLVRTDPPFDNDYFFATLLLDRALAIGRPRVLNAPRALRDANEKLFIFEFPELIAPTIVTRSLVELRAFMETQGGQMVVKPLDGAGGRGVFHIRSADTNTGAILEMLSDDQRRLVMAQAYLPAVRQGDKRILLLGGEPIGAVLRVPQEREARGNLHVGGTAVRAPLTERDQEICAVVGPRCAQEGLHFVGIDVIGEQLTEVNVTSPTGVREINRLENIRLEERIVDWLEAHIAAT